MEQDWMRKQETDVKKWIEIVLARPIPEESLHEILKDGIILCELINKITDPEDASAHKFPSHSKASFVQMENISFFIESARKLGVPDSENFSTVDLFEGKNMKQVLCCLCSLSRNLVKNGRTDIPVVGPRLVEGVQIHFTQDQIDEAKRAVSLQYGFIKEQHNSRQ